MHRKTTVLWFIALLSVLGCQTTRTHYYRAQDVESYREQRITEVTLTSGDRLYYTKPGGFYSEEKNGASTLKRIVGFNEDHQPQNIDLAEILEVKVKTTQSDGVPLILSGLLAVGLACVVIIAMLAASWH